MNRAAMWILVAAIAIVVGSACGGGGGGSSGSTATSTSGSSGYIDDHIAASLANGSAEGINLSDVAAGEQIQLAVAVRNSSNQYVTLPGSNWTTNAPASVATVSSTGLLTAVAASSTTYSVSATDVNGTVTASLVVLAPQSFVTGLARDINDVGIPDVLVQFYSAAGNLLTQATTSANGTFQANVPVNAAAFTINIEQADPPVNGQTIFYRQFDYGSASYLDGNTSCLTKLPAIAAGKTTALPNDIVLDAQSSGPPPPPTGCASG